MKAFRNPFLLVVLLCSLFLVKCTCGTEEDPDTLVKEISKAWKISALTVTTGTDNQSITTGIDGFTLTLNQSGDAPTTYTIVTGGLAYNFAPNTSGSWSLAPNNNNPTSITFSNSTVELLNVSKDQLVIQYKEAAAPGKPEPVVKFTLVPKI